MAAYTQMADHIYVIKRDGSRVPVSFDQILQRIRTLGDGIEHVNPDLVGQKVCNQLADGMHTSQLDEFAAETCAMMQARHHPNYGVLAARIVVDNHHKNTPATLIDCVEALYHGSTQNVSEDYHSVVCAHAETFQAMIEYSRDSMFDYFGFKTLERGYLLRQNGAVVERPQHMWMRVAIQLHSNNFERVKETYDALSQGYFIHATPTLFNAGGVHPQLSSCFLLTMDDDSIRGIYKTLSDCAQISKWSGGIGLAIHDIRARGSKIHGTNGESTGIVPMLKVFNDTAKYVNQGGKRNGSFAMYIEPWHADVEDFLKLKVNQGAEEDRARDLFYALWVPDLFMKRVEANQDWTLMCPNECPGLAECHGEAFDALYLGYEAAGKGRRKMPAQKLWQMILDAQIQTGTPYLCYKDAVNNKSNQKNLGTIRSSNLCVAPETLVLTSKGHIPIKDLAGKGVVQVWNGDAWSDTTIHKTGENQPLVNVRLSNRAVLTCTPYHKFLIHDDALSIKDSVRVEAQNLKQGMQMRKFTAPGVAPSETNAVVTVEHVWSSGRSDDTYCFTEPINNAGVFNGVLTGNCAEINEFTSQDETAVCNLGSIALPRFVEGGVFNFEKLRRYTRVLARNLDIVIDKNYYPTPECHRSNLRNRPMGIGVQGLADVFAMMRLPWTSEGAARMNREIFENIYFAAADQSAELAQPEGEWHGQPALARAYSSFGGSPASEGKLQCDLWADAPRETPYLDWAGLRARCAEGMRNSLLVALMPTASTSQILGNNECFEPFTSNLYSRRVLAGEFMVINKHLVEDLTRLGLWTADMRTQIIADNGSVQNIAEIPEDVRALYKTVWEIPQKTLIDMSRARAPFVCQSQSLNLFLTEPTYAKISSMHLYAWKQGLKTGCYYLRTKAAASAQKFTVEAAPPECLTCSA